MRNSILQWYLNINIYVDYEEEGKKQAGKCYRPVILLAFDISTRYLSLFQVINPLFKAIIVMHYNNKSMDASYKSRKKRRKTKYQKLEEKNKLIELSLL